MCVMLTEITITNKKAGMVRIIYPHSRRQRMLHKYLPGHQIHYSDKDGCVYKGYIKKIILKNHKHKRHGTDTP